MMKYFLLWIKVVKGYIVPANILKATLEYLFYFALFYFGFSFSIAISLFLLLLLIMVRLLVRLQNKYKELIKTEQFELILVKPIDPLFGILIFKPNPGDIFILLPILIYIKFRKLKP